MNLICISPREASIFACAADALLQPEPDLPAVRDTVTAVGFDQWLSRAPRINRYGVRVGLHLLELAPLATHARRFRALAADDRRAFLARASKGRIVWLAMIVDTLRILAAACYYSDDGVSLNLGYDVDARIERGRRLRAEQGRP
jgi:hypothetical protein